MSLSQNKQDGDIIKSEDELIFNPFFKGKTTISEYVLNVLLSPKM